MAYQISQAVSPPIVLDHRCRLITSAGVRKHGGDGFLRWDDPQLAWERDDICRHTWGCPRYRCTSSPIVTQAAGITAINRIAEASSCAHSLLPSSSPCRSLRWRKRRPPVIPRLCAVSSRGTSSSSGQRKSRPSGLTQSTPTTPGSSPGPNCGPGVRHIRGREPASRQLRPSEAFPRNDSFAGQQLRHARRHFLQAQPTFCVKQMELARVGT